ncbi:unnamed protein product, partial [Darwinula stevensoni]
MDHSRRQKDHPACQPRLRNRRISVAEKVAAKKQLPGRDTRQKCSNRKGLNDGRNYTRVKGDAYKEKKELSNQKEKSRSAARLLKRVIPPPGDSSDEEEKKAKEEILEEKSLKESGKQDATPEEKCEKSEICDDHFAGIKDEGLTGRQEADHEERKFSDEASTPPLDCSKEEEANSDPEEVLCQGLSSSQSSVKCEHSVDESKSQISKTEEADREHVGSSLEVDVNSVVQEVCRTAKERGGGGGLLSIGASSRRRRNVKRKEQKPKLLKGVQSPLQSEAKTSGQTKSPELVSELKLKWQRVFKNKKNPSGSSPLMSKSLAQFKRMASSRVIHTKQTSSHQEPSPKEKSASSSPQTPEKPFSLWGRVQDPSPLPSPKGTISPSLDAETESDVGSTSTVILSKEKCAEGERMHESWETDSDDSASTLIQFSGNASPRDVSSLDVMQPCDKKSDDATCNSDDDKAVEHMVGDSSPVGDDIQPCSSSVIESIKDARVDVDHSSTVKLDVPGGETTPRVCMPLLQDEGLLGRDLKPADLKETSDRTAENSLERLSDHLTHQLQDMLKQLETTDANVAKVGAALRKRFELEEDSGGQSIEVHGHTGDEDSGEPKASTSNQNGGDSSPNSHISKFNEKAQKIRPESQESPQKQSDPRKPLEDYLEKLNTARPKELMELCMESDEYAADLEDDGDKSPQLIVDESVDAAEAPHLSPVSDPEDGGADQEGLVGASEEEPSSPSLSRETLQSNEVSSSEVESQSTEHQQSALPDGQMACKVDSEPDVATHSLLEMMYNLICKMTLGIRDEKKMRYIVRNFQVAPVLQMVGVCNHSAVTHILENLEQFADRMVHETQDAFAKEQIQYKRSLIFRALFSVRAKSNHDEGEVSSASPSTSSKQLAPCRSGGIQVQAHKEANTGSLTSEGSQGQLKERTSTASSQQQVLSDKRNVPLSMPILVSDSSVSPSPPPVEAASVGLSINPSETATTLAIMPQQPEQSENSQPSSNNLKKTKTNFAVKKNRSDLGSPRKNHT